ATYGATPTCEKPHLFGLRVGFKSPSSHFFRSVVSRVATLVGKREEKRLGSSAYLRLRRGTSGSGRAEECGAGVGGLIGRVTSTLAPNEGYALPRQRSLVTVIRDIVQREVGSAIQSLLGGVSTRKKATNGRRRRRKARGKWRPGGPGRPPKAVAEKMARGKKAMVTPAAPKAKSVRRRR